MPKKVLKKTKLVKSRTEKEEASTGDKQQRPRPRKVYTSPKSKGDKKIAATKTGKTVSTRSTKATGKEETVSVPDVTVEERAIARGVPVREIEVVDRTDNFVLVWIPFNVYWVLDIANFFVWSAVFDESSGLRCLNYIENKYGTSTSRLHEAEATFKSSERRDGSKRTREVLRAYFEKYPELITHTGKLQAYLSTLPKVSPAKKPLRKKKAQEKSNVKVETKSNKKTLKRKVKNRELPETGYAIPPRQPKRSKKVVRRK